MTPLRVFIGWDGREALAYHVLAHSIIRRASRPVSITPLALHHLGGIFSRPRDPKQSTDFTYTRFLVPYLSGFEGFSVYMDCDMLALADLSDIFDACSAFPLTAPPAVWVAKHDYIPRTATKMDGQPQTAYPRKNWSSLIVFDNAQCRSLTPDYVNAATGLDLHRFQWLWDRQIGALPVEWNWLVGEYAPNPDAKILHYTLGGPWFEETRGCDQADAWWAECEAMLGTVEALDGRR